MKKVFSMVAICCLTMLSFVLTGCETDVMGDQMYSLETDEGSAEGTYMSYKLCGAEAKICEEIEKVAPRMDVGSNTFMANGARKKIDKKVKAAANTAMDAIEADSNYCKTIVISGLTVKLIRISGDGKEEVFSRTFKEKN